MRGLFECFWASYIHEFLKKFPSFAKLNSHKKLKTHTHFLDLCWRSTWKKAVAMITSSFSLNRIGNIAAIFAGCEEADIFMIFHSEEANDQLFLKWKNLPLLWQRRALLDDIWAWLACKSHDRFLESRRSLEFPSAESSLPLLELRLCLKSSFLSLWKLYA